MAGLFVAFEGGDGVGKTTQIRLLTEALQQRGYRVVNTYQPGDTPIGKKLRQILLSPESGDIDPKAEALLYAADKAQHLHEVIRPALARGDIVLTDRYLDSMLAYQGAGRKLPSAQVSDIANWSICGLHPDVTVLLDLDPATAIGNIDHKDRLEAAGLDFHQRVRDGFLSLANQDPDRYLVLYARAEIAANAQAIRDRVLALLGAGDD